MIIEDLVTRYISWAQPSGGFLVLSTDRQLPDDLYPSFSAQATQPSTTLWDLDDQVAACAIVRTAFARCEIEAVPHSSRSFCHLSLAQHDLIHALETSGPT